MTTSSEPRNADFITGVPCGDQGEDAVNYTVGKPYFRFIEGRWNKAGTVTSIVVIRDLPGLHCDMERVRVFDGATMIFEAPLHSLEGVAYPAPPVSDLPA